MGDSMAVYRDSVAPYRMVWPQMGMCRGVLAPYGDAQGWLVPIQGHMETVWLCIGTA